MTEPTDWTRPCAYCGRSFAATLARAYCSRVCHDRHAWYGVTPDTHRQIAVRRAAHADARRTSTTPTDTTTEKK